MVAVSQVSDTVVVCLRSLSLLWRPQNARANAALTRNSFNRSSAGVMAATLGLLSLGGSRSMFPTAA